MKKEEREKLSHLKREANETKSRLIGLMREVEQVSQKSADNLGKIIGRLEAWQNSK